MEEEDLLLVQYMKDENKKYNHEIRNEIMKVKNEIMKIKNEIMKVKNENMKIKK